MRMKKLEEIRLEVDSRRRTVQELTIKVHHDSWVLMCCLDNMRVAALHPVGTCW